MIIRTFELQEVDDQLERQELETLQEIDDHLDGQALDAHERYDIFDDEMMKRESSLNDNSLPEDWRQEYNKDETDFTGNKGTMPEGLKIKSILEEDTIRMENEDSRRMENEDPRRMVSGRASKGIDKKMKFL